MVYVGTGQSALKTGIGAVFETNAETYAAFLSAKRLNVGLKSATYLLDYYNRKGDLSGTIGLDTKGYERISGEKAKTEAEYKAIDDAFWRDVSELPPNTVS